MFRYIIPLIMIIFGVSIFVIMATTELFQSMSLIIIVLSLVSVFGAFPVGLFNFFQTHGKSEYRAWRVMNLVFAVVGLMLIVFAVGVFLTAVESGV